MGDLRESLDRARRQRDYSKQRGDDEAARLLDEAIIVLEQALEGTLVPGQRRPPQSTSAEPAPTAT